MERMDRANYRGLVPYRPMLSILFYLPEWGRKYWTRTERKIKVQNRILSYLNVNVIVIAWLGLLALVSLPCRSTQHGRLLVDHIFFPRLSRPGGSPVDRWIISLWAFLVDVPWSRDLIHLIWYKWAVKWSVGAWDYNTVKHSISNVKEFHQSNGRSFIEESSIYLRLSMCRAYGCKWVFVSPIT